MCGPIVGTQEGAQAAAPPAGLRPIAARIPAGELLCGDRGIVAAAVRHHSSPPNLRDSSFVPRTIASNPTGRVTARHAAPAPRRALECPGRDGGANALCVPADQDPGELFAPRAQSLAARRRFGRSRTGLALPRHRKLLRTDPLLVQFLPCSCRIHSRGTQPLSSRAPCPASVPSHCVSTRQGLCAQLPELAVPAPSAAALSAYFSCWTGNKSRPARRLPERSRSAPDLSLPPDAKRE